MAEPEYASRRAEPSNGAPSPYPCPVDRAPDGDPLPSSRTIDEELLAWLEGEPPEELAADAGRVREIASEFARGFRALSGVGRAVSVFGSAGPLRSTLITP